MAEIVVKYLNSKGVYEESNMYVAPQSTKLQRKFFDMRLDCEPYMTPGGKLCVDASFNNLHESGEISVPETVGEPARLYTDNMFFELHGMLVEVEGVTVYQPTRLHVNLSKAIQKQENEEIVNSNRRFKTVTVGNSSMRSYLSTVANNVAEINRSDNNILANNSVANNIPAGEDLTHLKRTLSAKKKVIDSMADATKNYLKTMSELSTKLELLEQLLAN